MQNLFHKAAINFFWRVPSNKSQTISRKKINLAKPFAKHRPKWYLTRLFNYRRILSNKTTLVLMIKARKRQTQLKSRRVLLTRSKPKNIFTRHRPVLKLTTTMRASRNQPRRKHWSLIAQWAHKDLSQKKRSLDRLWTIWSFSRVILWPR